jgi:hypothetical protein
VPGPFDEIKAALVRLDRKLDTLTAQGKAHMSATDDAFADLQAKVTANTNASAAIEQTLLGVNAQLQAALALEDPSAVVAEVQAISTTLAANTAGLVAATVANTTPAPAAVPVVNPALARPAPGGPVAPTTPGTEAHVVANLATEGARVAAAKGEEAHEASRGYDGPKE